MVRGEEENADMSAEDLKLCVPAIDRVVGGRREDFEASGVLLRFPMMLLAMIKIFLPQRQWVELRGRRG